MPSARLGPGGILASGGVLSADNVSALVMERDGALSFCAKLSLTNDSCATASDRLWTTATSGNPGATARMAEYGVLEVLPASAERGDDRLWQSHTMAACGCTMSSRNCAWLDVQLNGNVVMHKGAEGAGGTVVWQTKTHVLPADAKSVLHFVVDDLRPQMNVAYGQAHMVTPTFDALAREGLTFDAAYCNIAVCAPSRNSFMSGLRPDVTGIYNFANHIREAGQPRIVTMPQQFKEAGYTTLGGGKTFHYNSPPPTCSLSLPFAPPHTPSPTALNASPTAPLPTPSLACPSAAVL